MHFRAFIAIEVDGAQFSPVLAALSRAQKAGADIKPVNSEAIHLTLKFLGDVAEDRVAAINDAMRKAATEAAPFTIQFKTVGAFPNPEQARVVWAGIENGEALTALAEALDTALAARGFAKERRAYTPHVTLARVRGPRHIEQIENVINEHKTAAFTAMRVDHIMLKESVLTQQGPRYTTRNTIQLAGEAAP